ncbi:MAG: hypothetical protein MUE95_03315 [Cyclobacteriaceae bacterium]|nr:hypothetical protein [Cyclobacteriaceae bacterium]
MKKLLMVSLAVFLLTEATAQRYPKEGAQENETLFRNPSHVGWYVGPEFGYTRFTNQDVFLSGLSGGVIFNHNFSLGLGGFGIMNTGNLKYSDISDTEDLYLYGGWGGLKLEYRIEPQRAVHLSFPLLIGGGGLSYSKYNWKDYDTGMEDGNYASDSFFVVEPGVMLGLNLIKFMRLDIGISYRYAPNVDLPKTSTGIINTFNGVASLKFGKF